MTKMTTFSTEIEKKQLQQTMTTSLFIQNVSASADEIAAVFAYYGVVDRVDRANQTAIVHFVMWHNTSEAADMQRRIQLGGSVKVFYDGSLFWRVFQARKPIDPITPMFGFGESHTFCGHCPRCFEKMPMSIDGDMRPRLVRQDSKPISEDLVKPALFRHTNTLTPPIDFDALVTNPTYGTNINTPKSELRSLSH